jgi:alkanesulfonate monooxygenase SsuD/methylene tetrahydromethanopterin reductase-like flavin-dependent oxidoreductase (luciferase family)
MFDNESFSFSGDYYTVTEARVVPRPVRRVPIMIGGGGEKKTLRMVAEMADLCNIGGTANVVARKLAILDEHCAALGRNPRDVKRTALTSLFVSANDADRDSVRQLVGYDVEGGDARDRMIIATADEATENIAAMYAAGADEVIVNLPTITSVDAIHTAAEVMRAATS